MKIATIANYGSEPNQVDASVVTVHDGGEVFAHRKFESKDYFDGDDLAEAVMTYAQEHGAQELHTVKELLPLEEVTGDGGECVGRLSHVESN